MIIVDCCFEGKGGIRTIKTKPQDLRVKKMGRQDVENFFLCVFLTVIDIKLYFADFLLNTLVFKPVSRLGSEQHSHT